MEYVDDWSVLNGSLGGASDVRIRPGLYQDFWTRFLGSRRRIGSPHNYFRRGVRGRGCVYDSLAFLKRPAP